MVERRPVPHNRAALVLSGLLLAALAVGLSTTWIDDGDGTCGAIYRPNLARLGCRRKLMPAGATAAVLAGGAILAGDAARSTDRRPSRAARAAVGAGVVAVLALFVVLVGLDRRSETGGGGPSPPPTVPPPATAPNR